MAVKLKKYGTTPKKSSCGARPSLKDDLPYMEYVPAVVPKPAPAPAPQAEEAEPELPVGDWRRRADLQ